MSEIQIRPAVATDIPALMAVDHTCLTDYVWQMDVQQDDGQVGAIFREIRLPRAVSIPYARSVPALADEWNRRTGMLVAMFGGEMSGYVRMTDQIIPETAWITDVVVAPRFRRQGIGTLLIQAAQSWAVERKDQRAILEMLSKNCPAIRLAQKLGYEFCGYNDHYYATQDIALFFWRTLY